MKQPILELVMQQRLRLQHGLQQERIERMQKQIREQKDRNSDLEMANLFLSIYPLDFKRYLCNASSHQECNDLERSLSRLMVKQCPVNEVELPSIA
jgi:hypothetical protein